MPIRPVQIILDVNEICFSSFSICLTCMYVDVDQFLVAVNCSEKEIVRRLQGITRYFYKWKNHIWNLSWSYQNYFVDRNFFLTWQIAQTQVSMLYRGRICQFFVWWSHFYHCNELTGQKIGKFHLCALANLFFRRLLHICWPLVWELTKTFIGIQAMMIFTTTVIVLPAIILVQILAELWMKAM